MAWLDNSPVIDAEHNNTKIIPALSTGYVSNKQGSWWTRLPLFQILARYLNARVLQKKLNELEKQIHKASDNFQVTLELLRQLLATKRQSPSKLHHRIDQLKKFLIAQSHQMLNHDHPDETPVVHTNTHKQLLALMNVNTPPLNITSEVPVKLHWQSSAQDPYAVNYKQNQLTSNFVFLHASTEKLLDVLMKPRLDHHCDQVKIMPTMDLIADHEHLVSAIRLKVKPKAQDFKNRASPAPSFWQQQPSLTAHKLNRLIPENLRDQIGEIFFQTTQDYQKFNHLLESKNNQALQNLINQLEKNGQIIILHHDHLPSP